MPTTKWHTLSIVKSHQTKNPAIGGASQPNSMPVPSPDKWGGKPENPA